MKTRSYESVIGEIRLDRSKKEEEIDNANERINHKTNTYKGNIKLDKILDTKKKDINGLHNKFKNIIKDSEEGI